MANKEDVKAKETVKKEAKKETKKPTTAKQNVDINADNNMFSPENMAKMFAMFKQFQQMENENVKQEEIKEQKTSLKNKRFTKVMLSKIEDETVTVKSATDSVIFISPKSQITYNWNQKGDVETLSIKEILAMENVSKRFLHTPWLMIEDERLIQAFGLDELYDKIKQVEDIDELVKLSPEEIRNIFESLPNQYKNNFKDEIYMKVKNKELRDVVVISTLSDILGINLME